MDDSTVPQEEAAAAAAAAAAADKSPLYKPLRELTEDDIAQVTREDCRRFLKEKGMRRPSWNKSQAIQQVISLKALLEVRKEDGDDDNNAGFCGRSFIKDSPPLALPPPPPLQQQQTGVTEQKGDLPSLPPPSLPMPSRQLACVSTRDVSDPAMTTSAAGQMTVFYDGKVNVYDGVPPEKALMIMQLAASQGDYDGLPNSLVDLNQSFILPQLNPIQNISLRSPPSPTMVTTTQAKVSMTPVRIPQYPQGAESKNLQELELEGAACRKALLQRYLEKRKDRRDLTCKKKMERLPSSGVDFHLGQNFRYQSTNGQHYQSDIISPHPRPPSTPTGCPGNQNS